jgi:hypothetical protein
VLALGILVAVETAYKIVKRRMADFGIWPLWRPLRNRRDDDIDLELWQEMELDKIIKERLERLAGGEDGIEGQDMGLEGHSRNERHGGV